MEIIEMRIFYYLYCLEVIQFQLQTLRKEIKLLNERKSEDKATNLHRFRVFLQCIYESIENLNEIFGWSQITAISFCFIVLSTDLCYCFTGFSIFPGKFIFGNENNFFIENILNNSMNSVISYFLSTNLYKMESEKK